MCYGADLMKQNCEQKNITFYEFLMKVVDVTLFTQMSQVMDVTGHQKKSATVINNS